MRVPIYSRVKCLGWTAYFRVRCPEDKLLGSKASVGKVTMEDNVLHDSSTNLTIMRRLLCACVKWDIYRMGGSTTPCLAVHSGNHVCSLWLCLIAIAMLNYVRCMFHWGVQLCMISVYINFFKPVLRVFIFLQAEVVVVAMVMCNVSLRCSLLYVALRMLVGYCVK